jgi:hypothetical protein
LECGPGDACRCAYPHAAKFHLLADRNRRQGGNIKRHTVICNRLRTNGSEGFGNDARIAVSVAKEIENSRRSKRISDPSHEEHRTFENEAVAVRRRAQPVKETLERISREETLEIRSLGTCAIEEPCSH